MAARFLALMIFLGLAMLPSRAAIGDDLPTLRAAYGSAKQVGDQMLFHHGNYDVAVYFDGARSGMEIFTPAEGKSDFPQKDVDALLALEGAGQPWNPVQTHSGEPTWLSADGRLIARFNPSEKILAVLVNSK
jgi:hypothetical protein